jgi:hypothetical protein
MSKPDKSSAVICEIEYTLNSEGDLIHNLIVVYVPDFSGNMPDYTILKLRVDVAEDLRDALSDIIPKVALKKDTIDAIDIATDVIKKSTSA